jgi:hypothetical protein
MEKIYKYPTGAEIPEGAKFLGTVTQTRQYFNKEWVRCWLVWHYFLVKE